MDIRESVVNGSPLLILSGQLDFLLKAGSSENVGKTGTDSLTTTVDRRTGCHFRR